MPDFSVVVFTDVGVKDIDDELLLNYLYCTHITEKKFIRTNLSIVFMGSDGVSPQESKLKWMNYHYNLTGKFYYFYDNSYEYIHDLDYQKINKSIKFYTIDQFKRKEYIYTEYALQIAPMGGYDGSNLDVGKKYIFAGDYITPEGARPSFNRQDSEKILDRFYKENKLVDISSAHMATMRFNEELLSKFTGPFRESIVFTAFMLAFGRMNPKHSANKFAEGLINPNAGRGANYSSVMKMGFKLQGKTTDEFRAMQDVLGDDKLIDIKSCEIAAKNYCDSLEENGVTLKDREGTIKCLTDINIYLQSIIVSSALPLKKGQKAVFSRYKIVNIFESGSVFTSDFDINTIPKEILPAWEFFKQNAEELYESFNPVYDLFAGYVMVGIIKGEDRTSHTREEFLKNVVTEF